jgi:hypothetical protein
MKLRKHICTAALLGVALAFISIGTTAVAQGLQPPFMAPTPPSLNYGVFYFSAGAKYRNLHTFTMNVSGGPSTIVVSPGTVPFGPPTAGPFGVGTANGSGLTASLPPTTWTYNNGQACGVPARCYRRLRRSTSCMPPDQLWLYLNPGPFIQPELGRFVFTIGDSPFACCIGTTAPGSIGSFQINDPATQVNNPGSIAGTTTVTFTVGVPGSLAFTTNTSGLERVFEGAVVGPSLETGISGQTILTSSTDFGSPRATRRVCQVSFRGRRPVRNCGYVPCSCRTTLRDGLCSPSIHRTRQ